MNVKRNFHNLNKIPTVAVGILLLILHLHLVFVSTTTNIRFSTPRDLAVPPQTLLHMHFGFNEVLADSMWLRSIQDFDYCEQQLAQNLCKGQSWLFQMLDLITELSPKFRMPLATGPMALSVLTSDIDGATKLFDKSVERFPKDWPILYRAAYHAIYEEKNPKKGADLMQRAAQNGAPAWTYSLAARLYTDAGQRELAERILQENDGMPEEIKERIRQKLQSKSLTK